MDTAPANRNSGQDADRGPDGRFRKGNPGKPRGSRNKATMAIQQMLEGQAEVLTRKAVELALAGDTTALRLCMERLAPVKKDAPVAFPVPKMHTADDAVQVMASVLEAVAGGILTPLEGGAVASLVEGFRKTLETQDIERRLVDLENR